MADNNLNHKQEIFKAARQANKLVMVRTDSFTDTEHASRAYNELRKIYGIHSRIETEQLGDGRTRISAFGLMVARTEDAISDYYEAVAALSAKLSVAACAADVKLFARFDNFVTAHFALFEPTGRYFREVPSGNDWDFEAEVEAFRKDIELYRHGEQPAA